MGCRPANQGTTRAVNALSNALTAIHSDKDKPCLINSINMDSTPVKRSIPVNEPLLDGNEKNYLIEDEISTRLEFNDTNYFVEESKTLSYDIAETKCFYEVLSENIKRKMYFDIDIDDKSKLDNIDTFIYDVCGVIIQVLPDAHMLITKSENNESPKCGIHIIIVNYFVENVYNAKTEAEIKKALLDKVKEINAQIPKYKAIRGMYITEEPLIKTTTNKIKRHENLKLIKEEK